MKLLRAHFITDIVSRILQFFGALVGGGLLLAIVEYLPRPDHTQFWDRFYDTGHLLVFGLFVILVLKMARAIWGARRLRIQYFVSMLISLGVGLIVEVWQHTHGRSAEWVDVFSDLMGIFAFAAIYAAADNRIPSPRTLFLGRGRLLLIASILVVVGLVPLWRVCELYRVRNNLLPQLMDFQQPWNYRFYFPRNSNFYVMPPPEGWPESSTTALVARIRPLPGDDFPGFVFTEPYPNWTGYGGLEIDVYYAEAEPREFVLRIHDALHNEEVHDRFRREIKLQPGFQTIKVGLNEVRAGPRDRDLDLARIRGLALYTYKLEQKVTFYLGEIRLVQ